MKLQPKAKFQAFGKGGNRSGKPQPTPPWRDPDTEPKAKAATPAPASGSEGEAMATYKVPETLEELQARDAADGADAAASATAAQEFEAPEGTAIPRSSFFQGAATTAAEPQPPTPSVGGSARP